MLQCNYSKTGSIMKYTFLLLTALSLLGACGVKPGDVEGSENHPRTYPDIRHDPLPPGAGHAGNTIR